MGEVPSGVVMVAISTLGVYEHCAEVESSSAAQTTSRHQSRDVALPRRFTISISSLQANMTRDQTDTFEVKPFWIKTDIKLLR